MWELILIACLVGYPDELSDDRKCIGLKGITGHPRWVFNTEEECDKYIIPKRQYTKHMADTLRLWEDEHGDPNENLDRLRSATKCLQRAPEVWTRGVGEAPK